MAYTKIPKSEKDLINVNYNTHSLVPLYNFIDKEFKIIDPFSFDVSKPKNVKVVRSLQHELDLGKWKNTGFNMVFGNGSRGGRGVHNKGFVFESELFKALQLYIEEGIEECKNNKFYDAIVKIDKLIPDKFYPDSLISSGGLNQKRQTNITKNGVKHHAGNMNIGAGISDVTLVCKNKIGVKRDIYLSLKEGGTVSFISLGVRRWFIESELKEGNIVTPPGSDLLNLLHINHKKFCNVFNDYDAKNNNKEYEYDDITEKLKTSPYFEEFLKSVIGYGYVMVHRQRGKTNVFEMTQEKMNSYLKIQKAIVEYPKNGSFKCVNVTVTLSGITIKFNIRNTNGGIYPTHLLANYTYN